MTGTNETKSRCPVHTCASFSCSVAPHHEEREWPRLDRRERRGSKKSEAESRRPYKRRERDRRVTARARGAALSRCSCSRERAPAAPRSLVRRLCSLARHLCCCSLQHALARLLCSCSLKHALARRLCSLVPGALQRVAAGRGALPLAPARHATRCAGARQRRGDRVTHFARDQAGARRYHDK